MRNIANFFLLSLLFFQTAYALPKGFVYLHDIDNSILQDIRYAGTHNVVGRPITGYQEGKCILTYQAALALAEVQKELRANHYSLKVYDCYRPQKAVADFIQWSMFSPDERMKQEFYPREAKNTLFEQGYFAKKSGHSRGSTIDLTIVKLPAAPEAKYRPGDKLVACYANYAKRYHDNSLDMGTGYDCLDKTAASFYEPLSRQSIANRTMLRTTMMKHHFLLYDKEWWHFTLKDEPYPSVYFDFDVK